MLQKYNSDMIHQIDNNFHDNFSYIEINICNNYTNYFILIQVLQLLKII